jgi:hypothetical protein
MDPVSPVVTRQQGGTDEGTHGARHHGADDAANRSSDGSALGRALMLLGHRDDSVDDCETFDWVLHRDFLSLSYRRWV